MRRTNIYLDEEQCVALDELAVAQGASRAEVVRRLIDRALAHDLDDGTGELAAIEDSFGVLTRDDLKFERTPDERAQHLRRIAQR